MKFYLQFETPSDDIVGPKLGPFTGVPQLTYGYIKAVYEDQLYHIAGLNEDEEWVIFDEVQETLFCPERANQNSYSDIYIVDK